MAKTKGMTSRIEDWAIAILAALKDGDDDDVFTNTDPWSSTDKIEVLIESLKKFPRAAIVGCGFYSPKREGGYDLNQQLLLEVMVSVTSREAGVARRGDDKHLGGSRIYDLVVAAFENVHPGDGFNCDEFHFAADRVMLDLPRHYIVEILFTANWINTS